MIEWKISEDKLELIVSDKLTGNDYEDILPIIDKLREIHRKPKFLIILNNFRGWDFSALWADLKYGFKHGREFGPMAVIGENIPQKWMTQFSDVFFPSDIRFFKKSEAKQAREWLALQDESPELQRTGT